MVLLGRPVAAHLMLVPMVLRMLGMVELFLLLVLVRKGLRWVPLLAVRL